MKQLFILLLFATAQQANCQCTATITASGATSFCQGGSVVLSGNVDSGNKWAAKTNFGGVARRSAFGFGVGTKGYIGGGSNGSNAYSKDFWEYNPTSNAWTQKADFGGGYRYGAVGFAIGGKGYAGTGWDSNTYTTKDFWEYDPATNVWVKKADFAGGFNSGATGFAIGSKGYIGTGLAGSSSTEFSKDFWEYDPATNAWTKKADFGGTGRMSAAGFSIGSKGYIGTGYDYYFNYHKDFWEYDQTNDAWTQKTDFGGSARSGAFGLSIGTKGYMGTGVDNISYTKDFWEYDPPADTWVQRADLGGASRTDVTAFKIGNKGYFGTGNISQGNSKDLWEYTPLAHTYLWSTGATTPSITVASSGSYTVTIYNVFTGCRVTSLPTAVTVHPGTVTSSTTTQTACGSYTWNGVTYTVSGSYVKTGLVNAAGCDSTANLVLTITPLPSVNISAAGPTSFCQGGSVVLFANSGGSGSWTKKADFAGTGRSYAVGFGIGTKGYIGTGGIAGIAGSYFKDFWEYDPAINAWTQKADFGGTGRQEAVGFSIGNKGYVGTGTGLNDFWEYDPATNAWTQKANFGGTGRSGAVGFSIGSKGYIGTGSNLKDFWEYDPHTDAWTQKANFGGTGRYGAVGFSIRTKGYIGTGHDATSTTNDFWEYNPATNVWTRKADIAGFYHDGAIGFGIGNKGYIGTGSSGLHSYYNNFYEFDPSANTWTQRPNAGNSNVGNAVGFSIGDKGYIGSGNDEYYSAVSNFLEYSLPASFAWSTGATGQSITVAASGSYQVVATDRVTGCSATSAPLVVTIVPPNITSTVTIANATCFNTQTGAFQIKATGGTLPYKYKLDTAAENKYQASAILKPLKAGIYKVNIKDSLGCVATTGSITITQSLPISATFNKTNATCIGKADGKIRVTASGGKAPYGYKVGLNGNYNDSNLIIGLKAGTYTIYIKDANGCIGFTAPIVVGQVNVNCLSAAAEARAAKEAEQSLIELILTPNPTNQNFTLRIFSTSKATVQLRVLDVNGKTLYTAKGQPDQAFRFGAEFVSGIYLVEVRQGDEVKTVKAIKM